MKKLFIILILQCTAVAGYSQIKASVYAKELKSYSYTLTLYDNKEFKAVESYTGGMQMNDHTMGTWQTKGDTLILNIEKLGTDFIRMQSHSSQEKLLLKRRKLKTLKRDNQKIRRPTIKLVQ